MTAGTVPIEVLERLLQALYAALRFDTNVPAQQALETAFARSQLAAGALEGHLEEHAGGDVRLGADGGDITIDTMREIASGAHDNPELVKAMLREDRT